MTPEALPDPLRVALAADSCDAQRVAAARLVRLSQPAAVLRIDADEYILLRKLEWFRRRGETSDREAG